MIRPSGLFCSNNCGPILNKVLEQAVTALNTHALVLKSIWRKKHLAAFGPDFSSLGI